MIGFSFPTRVSGRRGGFLSWNVIFIISLVSLSAADPGSGPLVYLDDFRGNDTQARFVIEAELYSGRIVGASGDDWWEVNGANQLFLEGPNAGQTAPGAFPGARDNYMEALGPSFLPIVPFDPSYNGPYLDYKVRVETTGNYEFFARWAARDGETDSFYVYILDPAGAPLLGSGPDFFTFHQSHGTWVLETRGIANSTVTGGVGFPDTANWTIDQSGDYTIRVAQRETETALDAFIFQTANLATPVGVGPPVSVTVPEPSQIVLLIAGLSILLAMQRKRPVSSWFSRRTTMTDQG